MAGTVNEEGVLLRALKGSASGDGKTITLEGRFDDPAKGPGKWHSVTKTRG
jgi:hypothetical protein